MIQKSPKLVRSSSIVSNKWMNRKIYGLRNCLTSKRIMSNYCTLIRRRLGVWGSIYAVKPAAHSLGASVAALHGILVVILWNLGWVSVCTLSFWSIRSFSTSSSQCWQCFPVWSAMKFPYRTTIILLTTTPTFFLRPPMARLHQNTTSANTVCLPTT